MCVEGQKIIVFFIVGVCQYLLEASSFEKFWTMHFHKDFIYFYAKGIFLEDYITFWSTLCAE